MPILHSVVSEADSHIYMPVIQQVAQYLINSLNLGEYIKNNIYIDTGWTAPKGTRKNHTFFTRTYSLKISADQHPYNSPVFDLTSFQFSPGHGFTPSMTTSHLYTLLNDESSEIQLFESYMPASFTLNCAWWIPTRNVSYEVMKKMHYRFNSGVISNISLTYDYPLPKNITAALYKLYKHRKFDKNDKAVPVTDAETKVTFADWLSAVANCRFVTVKHRARKNKELCVSKVIDNALIEIDFDAGKPEEQKVGNVPDIYQIPFTVKLQFEEAAMTVIKYPCIVDNTALPVELIPAVKPNDTPMTSQWPRYRNPLWNVGYHTHTAIHQFPTGEIKIPYYDDWKVPWNILFSRSYRPFFVSLFKCDDDGQTLTLDLKGYLHDEYRLADLTLEVFREQKNESFRNDCIFNIAAYARDKLQVITDLYITDDLVLVIKAGDIHPQRHLVFSEITDMRYLNKKWWYIIDKYPDFFPPITDRTDGGDINGPHRTFRIFNTAIRPKFASPGY